MIDWHSHVLPGMDDGSRNIAESLSLLTELSNQGVDTVIATPHFYANNESVERFLKRRKQSYDELQAKLPENAPRVLVGAEVKYYPGISRMDGLDRLAIEGRGLLLLEMSMSKWTEYTVREVLELSRSGSFSIVLAHVERYYALQSSSVWDRFRQSDILMQVNADSFLSFGMKRKVLNLLKNGKVHFLGSDCHNMTSRPPHIGQAFAYIERKLGSGFVSQMHEYGDEMLMMRTTANYER